MAFAILSTSKRDPSIKHLIPEPTSDEIQTLETFEEAEAAADFLTKMFNLDRTYEVVEYTETEINEEI